MAANTSSRNRIKVIIQRFPIILNKNSLFKDKRAFMLDKPHTVDGKKIGYYMNVEFDVPKAFQKYFCNHKKIDESIYLKLKNFKDTEKLIRIAGKALLITGIALDAIELGTAISEDIKDSDNFLEKGTVSTAVEIGSRWTGFVLGAKAGAIAGATVGSTFPVIGTAAGGAVGGLIGGIVGSCTFSKLGEYVVDITWAED